MQYDVVVAGAGPAGTVAAREIAAAGLKVLIVEEHPKVGDPVHCSGLVTPRTLAAAGVGEGIVLNRIRGATIYTASGQCVSIGGDRVHALVIDRRRFDELLAEEACQAGADLALSARVSGVEPGQDGVQLWMEQGRRSTTIKAQLVIGADGSRSIVARGMGAAPPREAILATGGEMRLAPAREDFVEVFVGPQLAPGWFGWSIPVDGATVRVGIGSSDWSMTPRLLLNRLVSHFSHLGAGRFLRLQGGIIPVTPLRQVYGPRTLLAGDAAGQVKPTSGGGIYTSIQGAKLCARVALDALRQGDLGPRVLSQYQLLSLRHFGTELVRGFALRRVLAKLTLGEIDAFLRLFATADFQRVTRAQGDIDFPARLFSRLFTPGLVMSSLRFLPPLLWPRLAWLAAEWYLASRRRQPAPFSL
ncbi:MAG: NAD(P)/FAD-dependent oxidoreductase [Chloroflexi bacterium]|nr:NAD(P)/FAD-dependent oxidoreductase [Chloroflexota bacterium]